ncbi:AAA family ATPase [Rheinheimera maricola]|uniref:AAA family ATPase n=1 Tax=Rheinheimera maricola TaxID=2793282 RepID=A0ABS7X4K6_9GAMM|nr:AAA family ATPase [Rheinheimera maricola]MBZ9610474.1 AAA family ATPase [Rheinheimera maricola]
MIYLPFVRESDRVEFYNAVFGFVTYECVNTSFNVEMLVKLDVFEPLLQIVCLDCVAQKGDIDCSTAYIKIEGDQTSALGFKACIFAEDVKVTRIGADTSVENLIRLHPVWCKLKVWQEILGKNTTSEISLAITALRFFFLNKHPQPRFDFSPHPGQLSLPALIDNLLSFLNSEPTQFLEKITSNDKLCVVDPYFGFSRIFDFDGFTRRVEGLVAGPEQTESLNFFDDEFEENFLEELLMTENDSAETTSDNAHNTVIYQFQKPKDELFDVLVEQLCLTYFGRQMLLGSVDKQLSNFHGNDPISHQDLLAAVFSSSALSELWAKNVKRTSYSLLFPEKIYHLFDQLPGIVSFRSYEKRDTSNTIHFFRHILEFKTDITSKLVKYIEDLIESMPLINDTPQLMELLWFGLKSLKSSAILKEFFEINTVQSLEDVRVTSNRLNAYLKEQVKGQPEALRQIINADMWSKFKSGKGLKSIFTFVGPSGVGKTHLALRYSNALRTIEQTGYNFIVYNMENFSDERAASSLVGAGIQYTDTSAGTLTYNVALAPRSVILFDEIEKAHPNVLQTLLTLIDSGKLRDESTQRIVDFSQCIVIFTSNLGHTTFDKAEHIGELDVFQVLRQAKLPNTNTVPLSPEFVNRLSAGAAIRFRHLSTSSLLEVASAQVKALDADDGGILDYQLDTSFAAAMVFRQLPSPSVRGFKAQVTSMLSEAKQKLFGLPESSCNLAKINKLKITTCPSCFSFGVKTGLIVCIGQRDDSTAFLHSQLPNYNFNFEGSLNFDQRPVYSNKVDAVVVNEATLSPAEIKAQLTLVQRYFKTLPLVVISTNSCAEEQYDDISLHIRPDQLKNTVSYLSLLLATDRIVRRAKQKQHAFNYQLNVSELAEDAVTLSIDQAVFKPLISVNRAENGVVGLLRERPDIRLKDVVGLQRAKLQLERVVNWLKNPDLLSSQNVAFPAGMLLAGPPGTGKTMLAKALAGECDLPFISLSVGDLISSLQNGTASKIDQAFKEAADIAPCIVFIDEIDTIASARKAGDISGNNAVNTLLTHLDGIQKRAEPVFVLAATNFPEALDPAVLRAGRLDEVVYCDLPDKAARRDFLTILAKKYNLQLSQSEVISFADMTIGMSGAQMDKIFRDYLYCASTERQTDNRSIDYKLMRQAIANVLYGSAKPTSSYSEQSKIQTAWHEAGHLLLSKLLLPHHSINFATIEPRNKSLGFVSLMRDETQGSMTASEIRAQIAVAMAGREAERLQSSDYDVSAGASGDIRTATRYAIFAVCELGLDPEFGQLNIKELDNRMISSDLQQLAECRIRYWLNEGQQTAAQMLQQNKALLKNIADALIERESLYPDDIKLLFSSAA